MGDRLSERRRLFDARGLHRTDAELRDDGSWLRDEQLAAILRFSTIQVLDVSPVRPLRVRFAFFPDLTFTHASSGPARLLWSRDELSADRVLAIVTRSGDLDVDTDGVVVRRPGLVLVTAGTSPVTISMRAETNEVIYTVLSARSTGITFPSVSRRAHAPRDPSMLEPAVMFMAGLCRIGAAAPFDATPLHVAAQEIARSVVAHILGDSEREAGLFARAMELVVADYADPRLSSTDVARRLDVAPRTLQLAFNAEGTTLRTELRDVRARAALRMHATNPALTYGVVAGAVGFGSESALYRAIRDSGLGARHERT